jgi:hypothetical protein
MSSTIPPTEDLTTGRLGVRRRLWLRRLGFFVGLGLLLGAVVMVWQQREAVTAAMDAVRHPSPTLLAILLGSVLANLILTAALFSVLMSRYGKVGIIEMQAVLAAAMLINFLPARPGLFGRVAYHKAVNKIRALDSAKTIVQASVISACISGYLLAIVFATMSLGVSLWWGVIPPVPLLIVAMFTRRWRLYAAASLIRYVEVMIWGVRYFVAFEMIGSSIEPQAALAFACLSVITTMTPFVSNGLGLREWTIGLLAPVLTSYQVGLGVTAELVNRAGEIIVVVSCGFIAIAWLAHTKSGWKWTRRTKRDDTSAQASDLSQ